MTSEDGDLLPRIARRVEPPLGGQAPGRPNHGLRRWRRESGDLRASVSRRRRRRESRDAPESPRGRSHPARAPEVLGLYDSIDADELPSAVFSGLSGLGKTHLARAIGYRACQLNLSVAFTTAAERVNRLEQAKKTAYLDSELRKFRRPYVIVIDELGYVTMEAQASNLFFQVIFARHDQGLGTIATTNLAFGKWNQIFANDAIAHVIVDRLGCGHAISPRVVFTAEGSIHLREKPCQLNEKSMTPGRKRLLQCSA